MSDDFFGNSLGSIGSSGSSGGLMEQGGGSSGFQGISNSNWLDSGGGNVTGNKVVPLIPIIAAGMQLIGGFLNGRQQSRQASRESQLQRESMMAERAGQREQVRAGLQNSQDDYARTIMRNRAAIAPWAQMYRGPRFTQADPNAPIYNPLSDPNHMFNQLGTPLTPPTTMQTPWNGG